MEYDVTIIGSGPGSYLVPSAMVRNLLNERKLSNEPPEQSAAGKFRAVLPFN